jgi:ionotropic glutamate receptor NMDA 3A
VRKFLLGKEENWRPRTRASLQASFQLLNVIPSNNKKGRSPITASSSLLQTSDQDFLIDDTDVDLSPFTLTSSSMMSSVTNKTVKYIGNISATDVMIESIVWLGGGIAGPAIVEDTELRIVTMFADPYVIQTEYVGDRLCARGIPCLSVNTSDRQALSDICSDYQAGVNDSVTYNVTCCDGLSIELLENVAENVGFRYCLYIVADRSFGSKKKGKWNGIIGDLVSGAAHAAFAPLSVTRNRAPDIEFSTPYVFTGTTFLASSTRIKAPLYAFLAPFSADLWIAIFVSLNITAVATAIYEWISPFGLNPSGRGRAKNFTLGSALWVMWGLLFSHLVAFKAPKSWPNKVLINVWGAFSVIFLASYTANIAALFAGMLFQTHVSDFHDKTVSI